MKATGQTQALIRTIKEKQGVLRETLELVVLRDLVNKLDPVHVYSFDAETMTFNKELRPNAESEEPLGLGEIPQGNLK